MGAKISKRHTYKSQPKLSNLSSQWSAQNYVSHFWNFEFPIFNDFLFFETFKFTIVPYRETKNLIYLENEWP